MGSMKSLIGLYAMATISMFSDKPNKRYKSDEELESKEDRDKRLKATEIARNKSMGLTEFFYEEKYLDQHHNEMLEHKYVTHSLWALNQKSADKKAKAKGWII